MGLPDPPSHAYRPLVPGAPIASHSYYPLDLDPDGGLALENRDMVFQCTRQLL